jgi:2,4-dienoyl-CoA reductase-like NADH-dependent reductase (Old Yellow Enzyme family)
MSILFEPASIGRMTVKNRLVRAATVEKIAGEDGQCTPPLMDLYRHLAEGGVGMIITGGAYPQRNGRGHPAMIGLHRDEVIDGYRELTDLVHRYDARIVAQIMHCGRQGASEVVGGPLMAPSAVPNLLGVTPVAMSQKQVAETVKNFGRAALRAKRAGFDGVQIHAAHGYLIHEFLSPQTNRRKDAWGGSFKKRKKFLLDIYQAMRRLVGTDFPVLLRMNATDYVKNGLQPKEAVQIAQEMSSLGVDAIEVSAGTWETSFYRSRGNIPKDYWLYARAEGKEKEKIRRRFVQIAKRVKFQEAYLLKYARVIKKKIRCPLILVGGLRTAKVMEKILQEGAADFISMCRPLIRDPEFPNLIRRGLAKKSTCLNCNLCMTNKPAICYQMRLRPPHF